MDDPSQNECGGVGKVTENGRVSGAKHQRSNAEKKYSDYKPDSGYHEIQKKDTFQKGWSLRNVKYIGN